MDLIYSQSLIAFKPALFKENHWNLSKNYYAEVIPSGNTE